MLKLEEILWEVTLKCNKNCKYCGSKDFINSDHNSANDTILKIAEEIIKYPPTELTLSGGEPGLLDEDVLKKIHDMFWEHNVKLKCVTNGTVLTKGYSKYFNRVGWSVNEMSDIHAVQNLNSEVVVITNFGTHNIWLFDDILGFIVGQGLKAWQIQLTEGEFMLPPNGIQHLWDKINAAKILNPGKLLVEADNLQAQHTCTAGMRSLGILNDGSVIPCLSMRSWGSAESEVQGNILETPLQDLWENRFKDRRFGRCTKCCRDCIKFPEKKPTLVSNPNIWIDPNQIPSGKPDVYLYGVINPKYPIQPNTVTVYGVMNPPQVVLYGVIPGWETGTPPSYKTYTNNTAQPIYGCTDIPVDVYGCFSAPNTQPSETPTPRESNMNASDMEAMLLYGVMDMEDDTPEKEKK